MPFKAFPDPAERKALVRERQQRLQSEPFGKWQFVEVHFTSTGQDFDIAHGLSPANPEDVRYIVVRSSAPCSIYQDLSASRRPWLSNTIFLRSNATARVRLLLILENSSNAPSAFLP